MRTQRRTFSLLEELLDSVLGFAIPLSKIIARSLGLNGNDLLDFLTSRGEPCAKWTRSCVLCTRIGKYVKLDFVALVNDLAWLEDFSPIL